jgi:Glu-tRNA(Gln) amidotransferase subunit E-like FAD-binding protein
VKVRAVQIAITKSGHRVAVEVELAQKSADRLRAILAMHALWRLDRRTNAVMYVCGDQDRADRIERAGAQIGFVDRLRIELLETITAQAIEASEEMRAARKSRSANELQPTGDRPD